MVVTFETQQTEFIAKSGVKTTTGNLLIDELFSPQDKDYLQSAVVDCLKLSREGDCSGGPHGPIGEWDVSKVTDMSWIFWGAESFDGDISKWDVSRVIDMRYMFTITKFNGDISKWDVSRVTNMRAMFANANLFNGDISKWDVSSVVLMDQMFMDAASFNGDISKWDVSNVKDMSHMLRSAKSFNSDISKWDVSSVTTMDQLFMGATSFNQQLCGAAWVHSFATKHEMFEGSSGSISSTSCRASSPQRWLARWRIASTPITTSLTTPGISSAIMLCANCGTFKKSGRVSCCAPGGAWYKNCGSNFDHSWFEGVEACKRKSKVNGYRYILLN